jgi:hypothetical protein
VSRIPICQRRRVFDEVDTSGSGASSVIYSTYLGGSGSDKATGIALDSTGNAYVTGVTQSTNFPLTNAFQTVNKAVSGNAFLAELNQTGSALLYSTYFGGSVNDSSMAIALDSVGHAYLAGNTQSPDLPTVNAYQSTLRSPPGNAFVAEFDTTRSGSASLLYATYLGGSNGVVSAAFAIAVDAAGMVHVGGTATSSNFPVVNGFQTAPTIGSCCGGAFYARLNPAASGAAQLIYSTYLGGSAGGNDTVRGIAVDASGNAYLAGSAGSNGFPTTIGAFQNGTSPGAFVTKVNPSLSGSGSLVYSALISDSVFSKFGTANANGTGIAVDPSGNAFVVGTGGPGIPLVNSIMEQAEGAFQSLDAGQTWTGLTNGLTDFPINALAIDTSTSPRTLYAGTGVGGVFSSTDGGLNWSKVLQLPNSSTANPCSNYSHIPCTLVLAVDPTTSSNVYAGTSAGVYKSADRGATWNAFNAGLSSTAALGVRALVFDGGTLYAGAGDGVYILAPGATSWSSTVLGVDVQNIGIDPTTSPHTLYTASQNSAAYKSMDGGSTWTNIEPPGAQFSDVAVDASTSPATLYGFDSSIEANSQVDRSTDGGNSWTLLPDPGIAEYVYPVIIAFDTASKPSTIYISDPISGIVVKSTDSGNTWNRIFPLPGGYPGPIALDPTTGTSTSPSTLYTATAGIAGLDTFVAQLDPTGSTLLFCTYLDGIGAVTLGNAIVLDASDNIYITGVTESPNLPAMNAYQVLQPVFGNPSAFMTKLGSQTLPESSGGNITAQVGVQTGTLAVTLPNISGSTTGSAPTLTVNPLSSATTGSYGLSNNLGGYDISTTATYSGSVTLCFQALTVNDLTTFNNLQLFHIVDGSPVNVTSSRTFSTRTICGTVTSLSPFVLFSPSTSTTLSSSLNPSTFGQSVTLTANVIGAGSPTGTVTFKDGSTVLASEPVSSGLASFSTTSLAGGSHSVTAVYNGDSTFLGSTSSALSDTVNLASTSATVTASASPSTVDQGVTFTASVTVQAPGSGTPTGTVTFKDGSTTLGTGTLDSAGQATFATSSLAAGSHSITAVYGGASNFTGSTSSTLSQSVDYAVCAQYDQTKSVKNGAVFPIKIELCDSGGNDLSASGVVVHATGLTSVSGYSGTPESPGNANPDNDFRFDSSFGSTGGYTYNLSTKGLATGTYSLTFTAGNDPATHSLNFGVK